MSKINGDFYLNDGHLNDSEVELLNHFSKHVARRYHIEPEEIEFKFRSIKIVMSVTTKLLAHSRNIYPYFLKIGDSQSVNKEVSNYNRASSKIPPLYIPPIETVIDGDIDKYHSNLVSGKALVAYRYISGRNKGKAPISLLESFGEIGKYRMIELIDELFGVVLRDFHSFSDYSKGVKFEHLVHNVKRFSEIGSKQLDQMVKQYNKFAKGAPTPHLPHGLVHGDLHCENIILNKRLSPIVIDFEMMRQQGCLLNDFAEFEVALIVAALEAKTDLYAPVARRCYSRWSIFEVFGIDKLSRCIRAIRANLADMLFREAGLDQTRSNFEDVQNVYNALLLRYLCSYSYVAKRSLSEERSLVVFAVLENLFELKYAELSRE